MGRGEGRSQCLEAFLLVTLPHLGPPEVWGLLRNARNEIMPGTTISGSPPPSQTLGIHGVRSAAFPLKSRPSLSDPVQTTSPQSSIAETLVPSGPPVTALSLSIWLSEHFSMCGCDQTTRPQNELGESTKQMPTEETQEWGPLLTHRRFRVFPKSC